MAFQFTVGKLEWGNIMHRISTSIYQTEDKTCKRLVHWKSDISMFHPQYELDRGKKVHRELGFEQEWSLFKAVPMIYTLYRNHKQKFGAYDLCYGFVQVKKPTLIVSLYRVKWTMTTLMQKLTTVMATCISRLSLGSINHNPAHI